MPKKKSSKKKSSKLDAPKSLQGKKVVDKITKSRQKKKK